ncbi:MAG: NADH-quinone oxidoreductase subunit M, partial [Alphaproteobacteria bacterium]|nr:NADH-quinone oxidoreductase subunit M [Alphaproteobacteria bacterium]
QYWLWAATFFAFAVRTPLFPIHSWYIDVTDEASVSVTMLFTGVILKTGAYGLLRFVIPMFPEASAYFTPYVYGLLVVAIFYFSFIALVQDDMKKLVLYLLLAHISLVVMGVFSSEQQSVEGAVFHLISLGVACSALFIFLNIMSERTGSSKISDVGGLLHSKPRFSLLFVLLMLSFLGFPCTGGFVGEFMILCGIFKHSIITAVLASTGMLLVASAMIVLYHRVFTGSYKNIEKASDIWEISDISGRESVLLLLMIGIVLFMGLYPQPFLDVIHSSVSEMRGVVNVI